jgi:hypothetical protein
MVGALWIATYYPDALGLLQSFIVLLWFVSGLVLSHRQLVLESVAGHRGFEWMKDRLLEASREATGRIDSDEAPWSDTWPGER